MWPPSSHGWPRAMVWPSWASIGPRPAFEDLPAPPMMHSTLSVIVVSFNSTRVIGGCLDAIVAQAGDRPLDMVVVDNASTDGFDPARAERLGARCRLNPFNVGFAGAVNQGLQATSGDIVLIVNPDCRLQDGSLALMLAEIERDPDCALLGPGVRGEDGRDQCAARRDPTALTGLLGRSSWIARRFPASRFVRRHIVGHDGAGNGASSMEVDWVAGVCMLARRTWLECVGGFSERYFLYWEDADVCKRLRDAGGRIRYVPGARVVHEGGGSSRSVPRLAVTAFHRSAYAYYTAHIAKSWWHPGRVLARVALRLRRDWLLARLDGVAPRSAVSDAAQAFPSTKVRPTLATAGVETRPPARPSTSE